MKKKVQQMNRGCQGKSMAGESEGPRKDPEMA